VDTSGPLLELQGRALPGFINMGYWPGHSVMLFGKRENRAARKARVCEESDKAAL